MELRQEIARGLRCRQFVPEQQRQRFVLAKLIEILGSLAAGRPHRHQALHHLRRAQAAPAALQLDLAVDYRRRPGLTKRFDQPRHPGMAGDQTRFQLNVDLKIQSIRHSRSPAPRG
jgi:hypothetical protein